MIKLLRRYDYRKFIIHCSIVTLVNIAIALLISYNKATIPLEAFNQTLFYMGLGYGILAPVTALGGYNGTVNTNYQLSVGLKHFKTKPKYGAAQEQANVGFTFKLFSYGLILVLLSLLMGVFI